MSDSAPLTSATTTAGNVTGVKVLNTFPEVSPMIDAGVSQLTQVVLSTIQTQIESPTMDLKTFEKASAIISAQYSEAKDTVSELSTFFATQNELATGLAPHLGLLEAIDGSVASLEDSVKMLDTQTKTLEGVFSELL